MKKSLVFSLFLFVVVTFLSLTEIFAQERQVEVNVDASKGQTANLGGRLWIDVGDRMRVVGDVSFSQALNVFLTPTDQVEASGQTWLFLNAFDGTKKSQTRPFVFGGLGTTQFIGQANDAVNAPMGVGVQHFRASGFEFTPTLEFTTKDFTQPNPVLGNAFTFNTYIKVPVGKEFRISLNPYVSRQVINGISTTLYGARIGFIRSF